MPEYDFTPEEVKSLTAGLPEEEHEERLKQAWWWRAWQYNAYEAIENEKSESRRRMDELNQTLRSHQDRCPHWLLEWCPREGIGQSEYHCGLCDRYLSRSEGNKLKSPENRI